jgi:branched-chain amino acid transport system permease protein
MNFKRYLPIAVFLIIIILIQITAFIFNVNFYLTQLTMAAYYSIAIIGLCMLMGYAGQISLGQAGFFAIGGYTTAVLTTLNLIKFYNLGLIKLLHKIGVLTLGKNTYGNEILHFSPMTTFFLSILISAVIAFLIGIPVLKLKGHYLAMATLGFGTIIYRIVLGTRFFGEADGITNIPGFNILPGLLTISGNFSERIQNYYIAWVFVIIGLVVLINLINSRTGRALRALHGCEPAANAMGINTSRYKLNVFVLSAVYASIAGFLLTHYNSGIGPSEASVSKSVRYVAIVAAGGMANIWGTLITGLILNFLSLRGIFGSYDDAVFGIILILIMVFDPSGQVRNTFFNNNYFLKPFKKLIKKER